jgi:hypothetical protein
MSNARTITKMVVNNVVSATVGFTVSNAITSSTNVTKTSHKVQVLIGAAVVSYFVSEKTAQWADTKVDATFDWYNATFNKTL